MTAEYHVKFATREEGETFKILFLNKIRAQLLGTYLVVCGCSINSSHVYRKKRENLLI